MKFYKLFIYLFALISLVSSCGGEGKGSNSNSIKTLSKDFDQDEGLKEELAKYIKPKESQEEENESQEEESEEGKKLKKEKDKKNPKSKKGKSKGLENKKLLKSSNLVIASNDFSNVIFDDIKNKLQEGVVVAYFFLEQSENITINNLRFLIEYFIDVKSSSSYKVEDLIIRKVRAENNGKFISNVRNHYFHDDGEKSFLTGLTYAILDNLNKLYLDELELYLNFEKIAEFIDLINFFLLNPTQSNKDKIESEISSARSNQFRNYYYPQKVKVNKEKPNKTQTYIGLDKEVLDAFSVLGISPTAIMRNIRTAYRNLSLKFHPDKWKQVNDESKFSSPEDWQKAYDKTAEIFKEINNANDYLNENQYKFAYLKEEGNLTQAAQEEAPNEDDPNHMGKRVSKFLVEVSEAAYDCLERAREVLEDLKRDGQLIAKFNDKSPEELLGDQFKKTYKIINEEISRTLKSTHCDYNDRNQVKSIGSQDQGGKSSNFSFGNPSDKKNEAKEKKAGFAYIVLKPLYGGRNGNSRILSDDKTRRWQLDYIKDLFDSIDKKIDTLLNQIK